MALIAEVFESDDTGNRGRQIQKIKVDSVTWKLNGIHEAKVSIHPLAADATRIKLDEMELAVAIRQSETDPDYAHIWQGVPKTKSGDTGGLAFGVEYVSTYLRDAYVMDTDEVFPAVEQMNIQTALVSLAQAPVSAGRNIAIGAYAGSGVQRDRTYVAEEYPNIYELIAAFPNLENGFDWDIIIQPDGARHFTPYYPRKGAQKDQYRMSLDEHGMSQHMRGLTSFEESTVNTYTDVIVTGPVDPTSGKKLRGRWVADQATLDKYGRKQTVLSENSEGTTLDWLNAKAQQIGETSVTAEQFPTIGISDRLFGLLWHGDSFPLTVDYGAIQINGDFRITELTVNPSSDTMTTKLQRV